VIESSVDDLQGGEQPPGFDFDGATPGRAVWLKGQPDPRGRARLITGSGSPAADHRQRITGSGSPAADQQ
jgi:hypothetical protein